MNPVYNMFNDIVSGMLHTENGTEYLSNKLTICGKEDEHDLSLDQLQAMLGMIKGDHPYLTQSNPLEFLAHSYQFQDKIKSGYLATQYTIIYNHEAHEIHLTGVMQHPMSVEGHSEYDPYASIPVANFQTTIDKVGLYGNIALVNSIAAQSDALSVIRGSYGGSFIYEFGDGKQSIRKYEPASLEALGIETDELQKAIDEAKEKVKNNIPVPAAG